MAQHKSNVRKTKINSSMYSKIVTLKKSRSCIYVWKEGESTYTYSYNKIKTFNQIKEISPKKCSKMFGCYFCYIMGILSFKTFKAKWQTAVRHLAIHSIPTLSSSKQKNGHYCSNIPDRKTEDEGNKIANKKIHNRFEERPWKQEKAFSWLLNRGPHIVTMHRSPQIM